MTTLRSISGDSTPVLGTAEYLWVDNGQLYRKTRIITVMTGKTTDPVPIIEWWTNSDKGQETLLLPAHYVPNPLRPKPSYIVLCEVRDLKDHVVPTNTRAPLRERERPISSVMSLWMGIAVAFKIEPVHKSLEILEAFLAATIDAGIMIHSLSNFDFKVGPRMAEDTDPPSPLIVCDHYWIAWYLLFIIATQADARVIHDPDMPNWYYVSTSASRESSKVARLLCDGSLSLIRPEVYITAPNRGFTTVKGSKESNIDPYIVAADIVDGIFAVIGGSPRGTEEGCDC
jgi:hypothetical protein